MREILVVIAMGIAHTLFVLLVVFMLMALVQWLGMYAILGIVLVIYLIIWSERVKDKNDDKNN